MRTTDQRESSATLLTSSRSRRRGKDRGQKLHVTVVLGDPRLPDAVKRDGKFNAEDLDDVRRLKSALSELAGYEFRYLDNHATLDWDLLHLRTDLVFNLCDEGFNNDPFKELNVPAVFETLGLPYTGSSPSTLAACYDKNMVRAVAMTLDIPVPRESMVRSRKQCAAVAHTLPALLKPNCGDGSEGITKDAVVENESALLESFERLRTAFPKRAVLVQEYLTGGEYSVGLIGNPEHRLRALPVLEVDFSGLDPGLPRILAYDSKWDPASPYWWQIRYRPARLSEVKQRQLVEHSMRLFERFGCRDYARFDFRADAQGDIKLLDVNPNPGWCWDGKLSLMAGFSNLRYSELLGQILAAAVERLSILADPPRRDAMQ